MLLGLALIRPVEVRHEVVPNLLDQLAVKFDKLGFLRLLRGLDRQRHLAGG